MTLPLNTPANVNCSITLRFDPSSRDEMQAVTSKQLDSLMRLLTVRLINGGSAFRRPQNGIIKLRGTKPDGTAFDLLPYESREEQGVYSFALTKNILSVSGRIICDVVCSLIADETYICSTEVFCIENLSAATDPAAPYWDSEFQTLEEAVFRADNAASNANSAAENASTATGNAIAVSEKAETAANNANSAAASALNAGNTALSAAEQAVAAAENNCSREDIRGCVTMTSYWLNENTTATFIPGRVVFNFDSEKKALFYLIKYKSATNRNQYYTAVLFPQTGSVTLTGVTSGGVSATRTVSFSGTDVHHGVQFSADGNDNSSCIPCQIWAVHIKE